VCGFEAEIAGNRIVGEAKEKQQAKRCEKEMISLSFSILFDILFTFFREYDAAISRGDGAYLLEEEKADIFKVKVFFFFPFYLSIFFFSFSLSC